MATSEPTPVPGPVEVVDAKDPANPIARAIVGAVVAALTAAIAALNNGDGILPAEWVAIVITFLVTGAAVWAIPTMPAGVGRYGKTITAAIVSALGVLGTGLADDGNLNQTEWLMALTALLTALLVSQTPEVLRSHLAVTAPGAVTPPGVTANPPITGPTGPTRRSTPPAVK